MTETKLLMSTETYSKILEIAEQSEDSIKRALQSDESNEDISVREKIQGGHTRW